MDLCCIRRHISRKLCQKKSSQDSTGSLFGDASVLGLTHSDTTLGKLKWLRKTLEYKSKILKSLGYFINVRVFFVPIPLARRELKSQKAYNTQTQTHALPMYSANVCTWWEGMSRSTHKEGAIEGMCSSAQTKRSHRAKQVHLGPKERNRQKQWSDLEGWVIKNLRSNPEPRVLHQTHLSWSPALPAGIWGTWLLLSISYFSHFKLLLDMWRYLNETMNTWKAQNLRDESTRAILCSKPGQPLRTKQRRSRDDTKKGLTFQKSEKLPDSERPRRELNADANNPKFYNWQHRKTIRSKAWMHTQG